MPGGDRTGPMGMGAMTGRRAGFCAGYGMPGYGNPVMGRGAGLGFGRGRGAMGRGFGWRGRGWRPWFSVAGFPAWMGSGGYAVPVGKPDPDFEKRDLKDQAEALQSELDAIKERLSEIESAAEKP